MDDGARTRAVALVMQHVDPTTLQRTVADLVSIPSPTGSEAPLAEHLARSMSEAGVPARTLHLDPDQADAVGRLAGTGAGPNLLLYSPLDTFTTGAEAEDVPWIGPVLRPDMRPEAAVDGPYVTGLGAGNPKAHAACVLVAVQALAAAGVPLLGDVVAGFGAGGMPGNVREPHPFGRSGTGHGAGATHLLEQGGTPDFAVIAKPGWSVSHEEVGLCWFDVTVHGISCYVGSRHRMPYSNPIVSAGRLAVLLEGWLADYAERNRTGTFFPQGVIGSIRGGWERMVAATPAACRMRLDIRTTPGTTAPALRRELSAAVAGFAAELGVRADVDLVVSVPGSHTDPASWVVRSAVTAWEAVAGELHVPGVDNSGATDAEILRMRGVPTARVGMPKVDGRAVDGTAAFDVDFQRGMNTADVREMVRLTEVLVRTAIDTAGRPLAEVGL